MDRFADRIEDRKDAREHVVLPAHDNPQPAGGGFSSATEYRGVQERNAFLGIRAGLPSARLRMHRGTVEYDLPAPGGRQNAAGAEDDFFDRLIVDQAIHHHLGVSHGRGDVRGGRGALLYELLALFRITTPDGQVVTRAQKRARNSAAHHAQADKCDPFHGYPAY